MPEIAEVELIKQGLEQAVGQWIDEIEIKDQRLQINDIARKECIGHQVNNILRHGKLLGIELDNNKIITIHLRMTGQCYLPANQQQIAKARLIIDFTGFESSSRLAHSSNKLAFVDPRRFGTVALTNKQFFANGLGPDLFTDSWQPALEQNSRRASKAVLLDQKVIAGIGNYLADESLWQARVHPEKPWQELDLEKRHEILTAALQTAQQALNHGGVSIKDYRDARGTKGAMQEQLQCYGRAGLSCFRCQRQLKKITVAGRGTTYCPTCQKVEF